MTDELKPCPFCGGEPKIVKRDVEPQGDSWYGKKVETFVLCDCGACLFDGGFHEGFYDAETRAVEAWNHRTPISEECPCNEPTCVEPWEPGCGLGNSEEHAMEARDNG